MKRRVPTTHRLDRNEDSPPDGPADPVGETAKETADVAASTEAYSRRFSGRVGAWMLGVQSATLLAMLLDLSDSSVLDVGGGHAQVSPMLDDMGYSTHTVVSRSEATERLIRMGISGQKIRVGDLMDLPFADRSFGAVVSVRMMAHVQDLPGYVGELCRVADRAVVVDYTCMQGLGRAGTWLFSAKRALEGDTRRYTVSYRSEISELFEKNGFMIDQHVGQFALPLVLHRKLRVTYISRALEFVLRPLARRFGNPVLLRATRRDETS